MKTLLTRDEFEREFGGPKKTKFYELLNAEVLKAVKVGRRTFIRREDAEAWVKGLPLYQSQATECEGGHD